MTEETNDRRKSGRPSRKPDNFLEEHHEGSLLSNGSMKRKRTTNGTADGDPEEGVDDDEEFSSEASEGEADEEELKEHRRAARAKPTGKPAHKKSKIANGVGTPLAIRSANVQSNAQSKPSKAQKARARQSQAHQEGLYGR